MRSIAEKLVIGKRIKARADALGLSERNIFEKMGGKKATVNTWMRGSSIPGHDNLIMLGEILRKSPAWILTGVDGEEYNASSLMQRGLVRDALKVARYGEMQSGEFLSPDEHVERVVDIYFRLENDLGLDGYITVQKPNDPMVRKAVIRAQQIIDWIIKQPDIDLTDDERFDLYELILEDSHKSILLGRDLDQAEYLSKVLKKTPN